MEKLKSEQFVENNSKQISYAFSSVAQSIRGVVELNMPDGRQRKFIYVEGQPQFSNAINTLFYSINLDVTAKQEGVLENKINDYKGGNLFMLRTQKHYILELNEETPNRDFGSIISNLVGKDSSRYATVNCDSNEPDLKPLLDGLSDLFPTAARARN